MKTQTLVSSARRVVIALALCAAAALPALAGVNWTGNVSSDISNSSNWASGTGEAYIRNDFLTGDKNAILKLTGNVGKIQNSYRSLHFGLNPDGTPWRLTGSNSSTIYTLDLASGSKAINIGTWSSASSWVRMYAVNVKATNLNIGDSTTKTGRLQLDNLDDNASAVLGPVTLTADTINIKNGELELKTGATVSTKQDINVGSTGTGRLVMNGGEFTLSDKRRVYALGDGSGAKGIICLKDGTLVARQIQAGTSGTGEVVFDGGTLKFDPSDGYGAGITADRMSATVGAGGGTVNVNGKTPTIACGIASAVTDDPETPETEKDGGLAFVGGGTAVLSGALSYTGATTVELGTVLSLGSTQFNAMKSNGGITVVLPSTLGTSTRKRVLTRTDGEWSEADLTSITLDDTASPGSAATAQLKIVGSDVYLAVSSGVHGKWVGGIDSNFSTALNWDDEQVPGEGDTLDFSDVASNTDINFGDLSGTVFATVELGSKNRQIGINGTLRLATMTVSRRYLNFNVISGSKLIVDGDVTLQPVNADKTILYIVYNNGGKVEIGGKVIARGTAQGYPCQNTSAGATFAVKGINNNVDSSKGESFRLNAGYSGTPHWIIGSDGIRADGEKKVEIDSSGNGAVLQPADGDFETYTRISLTKALTLNTTDTNGVARTITLNNNLYNGGAVTVSGSGSVLAKYGNTGSTCPFTVTETATLAVKPDSNLTTGKTTVNSGATLAVSESGTVPLGGDLTLNDGATLKFTFTERRNPPVLGLTGKTVTFGSQKNIQVSLSGERPAYGENGAYALTTGGNFAGAVVAKAADCADWVRSVYVGADNNLYADVKATGLMILFR